MFDSPRVYVARPLAARVEEAPWHSGLSPEEIQAFHDAGRLPFVELGATTLVMLRDLEKLLSELARPESTPPPSRGSRRKSPKASKADPQIQETTTAE